MKTTKLKDIGKFFVHELIEGYDNEAHLWFKSKQLVLKVEELDELINVLKQLKKDVVKSNKG